MAKNRLGVDLDGLENHKYKDSGNNIFYTCPICRGEYLPAFIVEENGIRMCVECSVRKK